MALTKITNNILADNSINTNKLAAGAVTRPDIGYSGAVLQVFSVSSNAVTSVDNATFTKHSPYEITITPSSSNSKFLLMCNDWMQVSASGTHGCVTFYRNNSINLGNSYGFANFYTASGGYTEFFVGIHYVDAPATTSPVTYSVYVRDEGSGNTGFGSSVRKGSFTIMEISG